MLTRRALLLGGSLLAVPPTPRTARPEVERLAFLDLSRDPARSFLRRNAAQWTTTDWDAALPWLEEAERHSAGGIPLHAAARWDAELCRRPPGSLREWIRADMWSWLDDREEGGIRALQAACGHDEAFFDWRRGWYEMQRVWVRLSDIPGTESDLVRHSVAHPACVRAALPHARDSARWFLSAACGGVREAWQPLASVFAQLHSPRMT